MDEKLASQYPRSRAAGRDGSNPKEQRRSNMSQYPRSRAAGRDHSLVSAVLLAILRLNTLAVGQPAGTSEGPTPTFGEASSQYPRSRAAGRD